MRGGEDGHESKPKEGISNPMERRSENICRVWLHRIKVLLFFKKEMEHPKKSIALNFFNENSPKKFYFYVCVILGRLTTGFDQPKEGCAK